MEAVLLIALLIVGYATACLIWPYAPCGRCQSGRHSSPSGEYWRKCRRCGGSGKKIRLGRRLLAGDPDDD